MLYKLSIKPTRLELLKLIALDKSRYKEIRVAVRPLPFRFNRGIIDSDDFFQQFVDIVNDFLETYRQDITELFVALKENYFQVFDVNMPEYNEEHLHWEIVQYLTDDISNYRFGSYYLPNEQKVQLVIARTKLIDYFQKVFKAIYGTVNFTAIGFDVKTTKTETIFVKTDQEVSDYYRFGYSSSWNPENDIVAPQKSYKKYIIGLSVAAIVTLAVILINTFSSPNSNPSQSAPIVSPAPAPAAVQAKDSAQIADTVKAIQSQPPITTSTAKQTTQVTTSSSDIFTLVQTAVSANTKTLVINKNTGLLEFSGAQEAQQALTKLKTLSQINSPKISGRSSTLLTFSLTATDFYQNSQQNQQLFNKLSDHMKISTKNNYRIFNNPAALQTFLTELQKSRFHFSHLVISRRGNLYSLAMDFN